MGGPADPTAPRPNCQHLPNPGRREEDEIGARQEIGLTAAKLGD